MLFKKSKANGVTQENQADPIKQKSKKSPLLNMFEVIFQGSLGLLVGASMGTAASRIFILENHSAEQKAIDEVIGKWMDPENIRENCKNDVVVGKGRASAENQRVYFDRLSTLSNALFATARMPRVGQGTIKKVEQEIQAVCFDRPVNDFYEYYSKDPLQQPSVDLLIWYDTQKKVLNLTESASAMSPDSDWMLSIAFQYVAKGNVEKLASVQLSETEIFDGQTMAVKTTENSYAEVISRSGKTIVAVPKQ